MPDAASITHAELGNVLATLRYGVGASDLHGSLTGFLCAGGVASAADWLARLQIDPGEQGAARDSHPLLERLFRECRVQLDDPELGFEPMLPDDEHPLSDRAEALVDWCRGFLGGLGLAGVNAERGLSADGAEILRDLGTIAATHFEYDDAEEDESALAEVLEFIRVGVLLLHTELVAPPEARRRTLH
jgi:uncharacterized protein YgfB (UPF0149 family)